MSYDNAPRGYDENITYLASKGAGGGLVEMIEAPANARMVVDVESLGEMKADMRKQVERELRDQIREEMKADLKQALEKEVRKELKETLKEEVRAQVKAELLLAAKKEQKGEASATASPKAKKTLKDAHTPTAPSPLTDAVPTKAQKTLEAIPPKAENIENHQPTFHKTEALPPTAPAIGPLDANTLKTIDTARREAYFSEREKDMVLEINLVRSNPKGYAAIVQQYIAKLEQERALSTYNETSQLDEQIKTAQELVAVLNTLSPLPILAPHDGVFMAAKKHGLEEKSRGSIGHQGNDGSWPWDRIRREAPDLTDGNEVLLSDAKDVHSAVLMALLDTTTPNRSRRNILLNPQWRYVACSEVGTIGDKPDCWVQNFGN